METINQYVVRKLKEPGTNVAAICRELKLNRSRVYRLMNTGDGKASFVGKLQQYFMKAAE